MISPCGYTVAELEAMRQQRLRDDPGYAARAAGEAAKWEQIRVVLAESVRRAREAAR